MNSDTIKTLLATNEVYLAMSADTAKAHGASAQRWYCHINGYNAFGALVQIYSPLAGSEIFLSWPAMLRIEAMPVYE
jgi:hypothetical protein